MNIEPYCKTQDKFYSNIHNVHTYSALELFRSKHLVVLTSTKQVMNKQFQSNTIVIIMNGLCSFNFSMKAVLKQYYVLTFMILDRLCSFNFCMKIVSKRYYIHYIHLDGLCSFNFCMKLSSFKTILRSLYSFGWTMFIQFLHESSFKTILCSLYWMGYVQWIQFLYESSPGVLCIGVRGLQPLLCFWNLLDHF